MLYDPNNPPNRPVRALHRYFFALRPPPRIARQLANAADWLGDDGRPVTAERLHITLFVLPDFERPPADLVARLRAVGDAVVAAPIEIVLDYASGGGRSVALRPQYRIAALTDLYRTIAGLCPGQGIAERPEYVFQPHVTLGYRDSRPFGQRIAPVAWTATDFVLIHSLLGRTQHKELGRWPLTPREPDQGSLF